MNIGTSPECQFFQHETGVSQETSVCFRITRLMNNQKKKSNIPKRREGDDTNAVAIVKSVPQLGCVSQDSDALASQGRKSQGKPDAERLGTNPKGTIH